eukprot:ctg_3139.g411
MQQIAAAPADVLPTLEAVARQPPGGTAGRELWLRLGAAFRLLPADEVPEWLGGGDLGATDCRCRIYRNRCTSRRGAATDSPRRPRHPQRACGHAHRWPGPAGARHASSPHLVATGRVGVLFGVGAHRARRPVRCDPPQHPSGGVRHPQVVDAARRRRFRGGARERCTVGGADGPSASSRLRHFAGARLDDARAAGRAGATADGFGDAVAGERGGGAACGAASGAAVGTDAAFAHRCARRPVLVVA